MRVFTFLCAMAMFWDAANSIENLDCTEHECNSMIYDYHFPNLTSVVDSTFILIVGTHCIIIVFVIVFFFLYLHGMCYLT